MKFQSLRGTKDILPPDNKFSEYIEKKAEEIFHYFNYKEIRTPIFERTELFTRSIGPTTEVVNKQMYTFTDRKGRSLTLRPEGTAPVVRAYLQNQLYKKEDIIKFYYKGPFFRYERPQGGREGQFHQIGVEVIGGDHPAIDAEIIWLGHLFLKSLNLEKFQLLLGSVGCQKCRPLYEGMITSILKKDYSKLCDDCRRRYNTNPLRILDCKNEKCKAYFKRVPSFTEYLCEGCSGYFKETGEFLNKLKIKYNIHSHLVRGLDYYTHNTFEFIYPDLAAQSTLIGGGRYNELVEQLGGASIPACGFAAGVERIMGALEMEGKHPHFQDTVDVMIITIGEEPFKEGFILLQRIREAGISADMDYCKGSLRSQFRRADKMKVSLVVVIGENEAKKKIVKLKNMNTGNEESISFDNLVGELKKEILALGKK